MHQLKGSWAMICLACWPVIGYAWQGVVYWQWYLCNMVVEELHLLKRCFSNETVDVDTNSGHMDKVVQDVHHELSLHSGGSLPNHSTTTILHIRSQIQLDGNTMCTTADDCTNCQTNRQMCTNMLPPLWAINKMPVTVCNHCPLRQTKPACDRADSAAAAARNAA